VEREVIVITGPTASGKTALSIEVAEKLNTEIISADSRQFYKLMNIGTAKPSDAELGKVKHHLISFLEPDQEYNASLFRKAASDICEKLWNRGQIPVITGGSGLYIKSLIDGLSDTPDPDPELRKQLLQQKEELGIEFLYDRLKKIDPYSASNMIPQNWKRIIRALEVYYLTGKPISYFHNQHGSVEIKAHQFGLMWDREILYKRINQRTEGMIKDGLVEEVKSLLDLGYDPQINSLNTVGYKEIISFLKKEITLDKAIELIKRNTRRYAKRQITWFRKDQRILWKSIETNEDLFIFGGSIISRFS
jgi:tRNA dimethylallyltransferase